MHPRVVELGFVAALLATAAACGDDKNYGDPINNAAAALQAKAAVEASAGLSTLETDPDNDAALTKVSGLYNAMQILLNAKLAATQGGDPYGLAPQLMRAAASKPLDTTCIAAVSGRVTYTNCDLGTGTINGTIRWSAGSFTIDIEMSLATGETEMTMHERGTLTVTSTAITGSLAISAEGSIDTISFDYAISSTWNVTLAAGLATDGYLEVHGDWSVRSPQANASYDLWVKAEFDGATVTLY